MFKKNKHLVKVKGEDITPVLMKYLKIVKLFMNIFKMTGTTPDWIIGNTTIKWTRVIKKW